MDKIIIRDLKVRTIIGTAPEERIRRQELTLNVELYADFSRAAASDHFHDTFDYSLVERELKSFAEASECQLLEALSQKLASHILALSPLIQGIRLRIEKPAAAAYARWIGIEIERGITK